jgi:uncharacterized RDD family membrane protein YckC
VTDDVVGAPRTLRKSARADGIPLEALPFQGQRAGLVSRVLANSIDFGIIVVVMVSLYVGWAAALFLWSPTSFTFPSPNLAWAVVVGGFLLGFYFWVSWATSGRTYGDLVMGLRVVNWQGEKMRWTGALVRAAFCVVFAIGLFWVLISGANRSIQDVVMRTSVIYDWRHRPRPAPPVTPAPEAG